MDALDNLIVEIIGAEAALRVVTENAQLLIFPSTLLPIQHQSELQLFYLFCWIFQSNYLYIIRLHFNSSYPLDRIWFTALLVGCLQKKSNFKWDKRCCDCVLKQPQVFWLRKLLVGTTPIQAQERTTHIYP